MYRYAIKENGKLGFIDEKCDVIIAARFDDVFAGFHDGYATVAIDGKAGVIDENGDWVVEPKWSLNISLPYWLKFQDGLMPCKLSGSATYDYVNLSGGVAFGGFEVAEGFSEGLALVKKKGVWRFIDTDGNDAFLLEREQTKSNLGLSITRFSEGMAAVRLKGEPPKPTSFDEPGPGMGFVDRSGKVVIEPRFVEARAFSEGAAVVAEGAGIRKAFSWINTHGERLFDRTCRVAGGGFSEGLACALDDRSQRYGYLNRLGEWEIEPFASGALGGMPFEDGVAVIAIDTTGYGFIDRQGKKLFDRLFKNATPFDGPLANVSDESGWGYVDRQGEPVWWFRS
ncbi:MAG: WG repeat-containing protein [Myxococcota bacterium]